MVQFSIGYIALGCGILLVLAALFGVRHDLGAGLLSEKQRAMLVGGVCGMLIFFVVLIAWLR